MTGNNDVDEAIAGSRCLEASPRAYMPDLWDRRYRKIDDMCAFVILAPATCAMLGFAARTITPTALRA